MRVGVGSYLFRYAVGTEKFRPEVPLGPVELVERAAKLGAELVQFAENLPLDDVADQVLDRVRETANRCNITLEAGTAGATEERLLRHLQIAEKLGAKLVRLTLHAPGLEIGSGEAIRVIRKVVAEYEKRGIALAIENHFTVPSSELISIVQTIDHPLVGLCVDAANSIANREWPEETVRLLAPWAMSVHMKDYKLEPHPDGLGVNVRGVPLGRGLQNIRHLLEIVLERKPNVHVVLEQWMPPAETVEQTLRQEEAWIAESLEVMKRIRAEMGRG
ncbi:sugar phosphate isomerase/epimerase family protein [Parageobacillus thermoglucosidasius]|uniref:sugar phosphate isomerase/epimerase family protein n=1 Tax=Parageobacillus thermoglucosidasius TaxID=1426 RepID=UPI000B5664F5|nr:sugar phosphate isomerase/epimerase family protein [Parageobacillus thermoglucosidasius]OUM89026.1 MAG: hypothetical protein BAA00_11700 [Parageobacillus thermoglucosidasius]